MQQTKIDLLHFIQFIDNHEKSHDIKNVFFKGPDPEFGFILTPKTWWTDEQNLALDIITNQLVSKNYDQHSSRFGIMMRMIQQKLIKTLPTVVAIPEDDDLMDNEGKFQGDPRTGKGSPFYVPSNEIVVEQPN